MNNLSSKATKIETKFILVSGLENESYSEFKSRIFELSGELRADKNVQHVKFTLTEERPPYIGVIPFGKDKISAIQVNLLNSKDLDVEIKGLVGTYLVENALPVSYTRDWAPGERTPGVCLLTLFRKKPGLEHGEFLNRWHNGHTPLSLEIHPLWHYSRNVVLKSEGIHYDGIVEEHCRSRSELMNPFKFFGGPVKMLPNMIRVYRDVRGFLDYDNVKPYLVSEYYLD